MEMNQAPKPEAPITYSDYESGDRGYYTVITRNDITVEGTLEISAGRDIDFGGIYRNLVSRRIKALIGRALQDDYLLHKFYVHFLKNNDLKVYGVGCGMDSANTRERLG